MYSASAIRILDSDENNNKTIRADCVYIIETNHPTVKRGWTMQEYIAKEQYRITDLQIDETKATALNEKMDVVIVNI